MVLETVDSIAESYPSAFLYFEWVVVSVFALEYILRLWSCTADPNYSHPLRGRLRFMISPLHLVDLVAVLPAFVGLFIPLGVDSVALRVVRLLARSTRLGVYAEGIRTLLRVFKAKSNELISVIASLMVILLFGSILMYYAEHPAQPETFSSIPVTAWWGIVTLTTVGYGDMAPVTAMGRLLAGLMAILGIGMFALPAAILASGFVQEMKSKTNHDG